MSADPWGSSVFYQALNGVPTLVRVNRPLNIIRNGVSQPRFVVTSEKFGTRPSGGRFMLQSTATSPAVNLNKPMFSGDLYVRAKPVFVPSDPTPYVTEEEKLKQRMQPLPLTAISTIERDLAHAYQVYAAGSVEEARNLIRGILERGRLLNQGPYAIHNAVLQWINAHRGGQHVQHHNVAQANQIAHGGVLPVQQMQNWQDNLSDSIVQRVQNVFDVQMKRGEAGKAQFGHFQKGDDSSEINYKDLYDKVVSIEKKVNVGQNIDDVKEMDTSAIDTKIDTIAGALTRKWDGFQELVMAELKGHSDQLNGVSQQVADLSQQVNGNPGDLSAVEASLARIIDMMQKLGVAGVDIRDVSMQGNQILKDLKDGAQFKPEPPPLEDYNEEKANYPKIPQPPEKEKDIATLKREIEEYHRELVDKQANLTQIKEMDLVHKIAAFIDSTVPTDNIDTLNGYIRTYRKLITDAQIRLTLKGYGYKYGNTGLTSIKKEEKKPDKKPDAPPAHYGKPGSEDRLVSAIKKVGDDNESQIKAMEARLTKYYTHNLEVFGGKLQWVVNNLELRVPHSSESLQKEGKFFQALVFEEFKMIHDRLNFIGAQGEKTGNVIMDNQDDIMKNQGIAQQDLKAIQINQWIAQYPGVPIPPGLLEDAGQMIPVPQPVPPEYQADPYQPIQVIPPYQYPEVVPSGVVPPESEIDLQEKEDDSMDVDKIYESQVAQTHDMMPQAGSDEWLKIRRKEILNSMSRSLNPLQSQERYIQARNFIEKRLDDIAGDIVHQPKAAREIYNDNLGTDYTYRSLHRYDDGVTDEQWFDIIYAIIMRASMSRGINNAESILPYENHGNKEAVMNALRATYQLLLRQ